MNTQIPLREKSTGFLFRINSSTTSTPSGSPNNSRLEDDVEGKVKTRLLSMWNNMKYGMKLKTNFSKESPVWLLGKCYKKVEPHDSTEEGMDIAAYNSNSNISNNEEDDFEGFKSDFTSRLWLTYRREFPVLNGSTYSSDCGWGCMLRSGQMLLAQALICHFLGRGWRWIPDQIPNTRQGIMENINHRKIIKWFGDKPSKNSPFSLHTLVQLGENSGKKPGDWYGPGCVAFLLREAMKLASKDNCEFDKLNIYVAQDCAVYIKDIEEECQTFDNKWKSLILLIPVRLGADKFNTFFSSQLTSLLTLEQCIGIIGGRPKHALYFIGYQDDKLIHLDPHYCQEMVDVWATDFPISSFHCRSPRKLHISKMDPSCCLGFYCSTREEFSNLVETLKLMISPTKTKVFNEYPMFVFSNGSSKDTHIESTIKGHHVDYEFKTCDVLGECTETEEFEIV
ncbi:cysteine protease ATG4C [Agrilus planipennis]|uniref:Cysteine protease n=1 Tax=Agrilus planipennis TaxID=224129 RepID=A0A7F5RCR8_AGRPL|nr:cysteine protease ATG4C [Agrilus planipennis]